MLALTTTAYAAYISVHCDK